MRALTTLISSAVTAIPIGFAFGFAPLILEGFRKAQKPEPSVTPGKIMEKLNKLQDSMNVLLEMQVQK